MRVALVSDMHGNAVAFRAVLADLEERDPDLIVSLGDVAQGGPQPAEVVELLRELDCRCVFGNSDEFLLTLEVAEDEADRTDELREVGRWSQEQLGDDGLELLRSFEPTVELDLDGTRVVCCHATPHSNDEVVLPSTPLEEVPVEGDIVAAGHVHLQWSRRVRDRLWFCVGSVGLVWEYADPPEEIPFHPVAEYALLHAERGRLGIELRRIPFDVEELIASAGALDFPGFESWKAKWRR